MKPKNGTSALYGASRDIFFPYRKGWALALAYVCYFLDKISGNISIFSKELNKILISIAVKTGGRKWYFFTSTLFSSPDDKPHENQRRLISLRLGLNTLQFLGQKLSLLFYPSTLTFKYSHCIGIGLQGPYKWSLASYGQGTLQFPNRKLSVADCLSGQASLASSAFSPTIALNVRNRHHLGIYPKDQYKLLFEIYVWGTLQFPGSEIVSAFSGTSTIKYSRRSRGCRSLFDPPFGKCHRYPYKWVSAALGRGSFKYPTRIFYPGFVAVFWKKFHNLDTDANYTTLRITCDWLTRLAVKNGEHAWGFFIPPPTFSIGTFAIKCCQEARQSLGLWQRALKDFVSITIRGGQPWYPLKPAPLDASVFFLLRPFVLLNCVQRHLGWGRGLRSECPDYDDVPRNPDGAHERAQYKNNTRVEVGELRWDRGGICTFLIKTFKQRVGVGVKRIALVLAPLLAACDTSVVRLLSMVRPIIQALKHSIWIWVVLLAACGGQTEVATGHWRGANWEVVRPAPQHPTSQGQALTAGQEIKALQALVEKQQRAFAWVTGGLLLLLTTAGLCIAQLVRRDRRRTQDKKSFIAQHIQDYDEQILRMLLVKAGYDEIKNKLKKEFGLDDDDFTRD